MANRRLAITLLACLLGIQAAAQESSGYIYADPVSDFRGRASIGIDKKIARGTHLTLDEEIRMRGNLGAFDRADTELGLSFKICGFLKAGADYTFIYQPGNIRHRAGLNLTGHVKSGPWNFSIRERIQCTHLTREFNEYQQPRNGLALKSRVKVSYRSFTKPLEPYAAVELRHTLNGSEYTDFLDPSSMTYSDTYMDRLRGSAGLEWRLGKNDFIDFFLLADKVSKKDIDAKKNGELKTITFEPAFNLTLGVAYRFKF